MTGTQHSGKPFRFPILQNIRRSQSARGFSTAALLKHPVAVLAIVPTLGVMALLFLNGLATVALVSALRQREELAVPALFAVMAGAAFVLPPLHVG